MIIVIDTKFVINIVRGLSFNRFESVMILFIKGTHLNKKIPNVIEFMMHRLIKSRHETVSLSSQWI